MLIDWFTIAAQVVNFLVLVALLRHFLYGPIINAMDQREERIAARIEEARAQQAGAEEEAQLYREKNEEFDNQRQELLAEAKAEVESMRKEMIHRAREEVDTAQGKWYEALEQEKDAFVQSFALNVGEQVQKILRRALEDLADATLERQTIESFLRRLDELDEESRSSLDQAIKEVGNGLTVFSANQLPEDLQQGIEERLRQQFHESLDVTFRTDPELIAGLALKTRNHTVAWNLARYLNELEGDLSTALDEALRSKRRTEEDSPVSEPTSP